jgi:hypothetical protein
MVCYRTAELFFILSFSLLVESMRGIYETVIEEFPPDFGKALSKREREDKKLFVSTLIYGEIDFDSFGSESSSRLLLHLCHQD